MMNIYWFELFLTVMKGDIGDTGWVGGGEGMAKNWVGIFPWFLSLNKVKALVLASQ